ncbi:hypothetical protein [Pseudomonas sp.]|uniref:hypothetical protein n=1 Tax=Pseudomonas sp. TaxID=306 RepID=UPI003241C9D9
MGSSGSGRFTDYPGTKPKEVDENGGGIAGGSSGVDKCKQAFSVVLEDVGNSDLYSQTHSVPSAGTLLEIVFDGRRIFAVDTDGVKIGALPTSYNYLAACLADGITYVGLVSQSAVTPIPTVSADFAPK